MLLGITCNVETIIRDGLGYYNDLEKCLVRDHFGDLEDHVGDLEKKKLLQDQFRDLVHIWEIKYKKR